MGYSLFELASEGFDMARLSAGTKPGFETRLEEKSVEVLEAVAVVIHGRCKCGNSWVHEEGVMFQLRTRGKQDEWLTRLDEEQTLALWPSIPRSILHQEFEPANHCSKCFLGDSNVDKRAKADGEQLDPQRALESRE